jgi:hypothetical protein
MRCMSRFVFAVVITFVAQACVLDDIEDWAPEMDDVQEWLPSEIEVHETLEDVGESAFQGLCGAFDGYIHGKYRSSLVVKAACTAHALRTTSDAAECTAIADDCLAKLPSPVEEDVRGILAQAGCNGLGVARGRCNSPISDLIACMGDLKAAIDHAALTFTCSAALEGSVPHDWWHVSLPTSCVDVVTRCHR